MRYYPLFLDLADKEVLVVGAGGVGRRKLAALVQAPLRGLTVVDPAGLSQDSLPDLPEKTSLIVLRRKFQPGDLSGKSLVFAATSDAVVNARIAVLCSDKGIWCNTATDPDNGDFFVPALCSVADLTVAVGTNGKSPALARRVRKDLEAWLGNRYSPALRLMERLRPMLREPHFPQGGGARILRALADSALFSLLEEKDRGEARLLLVAHLPESLHSRIEELLYDL